MTYAANFCPVCGAAMQDAHIFGRQRRVCTQCHYVHFHNPKVATAVFLQHQGQILLVQRGIEPAYGKWALPAGYVDFGEDPQAAARREVQEETGLQVQITRLIDVIFNSGRVPVIVIIYAADLIAGELRAGDDASAVGWFQMDDLPEVAFRSTFDVIQRWQSGTR